MRPRASGLLIAVLLAAGLAPPASRADVNFQRYLFGDPVTLSIWVQELDPETGYVVVNGVDSSGPPVPFAWEWGDGDVGLGWFPQSHTYADTSLNYLCRVAASYGPGDIDTVGVVVRFTAPDVDPITLPEETGVHVPEVPVPLISRMPGYGVPALVPFGDEYFSTVPRWVVEYTLSVAGGIQFDAVNGDVFLISEGFRQYVLRDPAFAGMYSLWYTSPVAFGAGDYAFGGTIQWSSFLHEMGHNVTLNMPADHYYGGKIDGCANAIYSETMAQIFQYATAYELMNNCAGCGFPDDLLTDIWVSSISAISGLRNAYDRYVDEGMNFCSWNDPVTPEDETMDTFATLAYTFCAHAETGASGYLVPLKRMTELLSVFDSDLEARYDRNNNTASADTFRSTLMVTAISYGFDEDLRSEFEALNFPISDATYDELMDMVTNVPGDASPCDRLPVACRPNPCGPSATVSYALPGRAHVSVRVYTVGGRLVRALVDEERTAGPHEVVWDGRNENGTPVASGVYLVRVASEHGGSSAKIVVLH